MTDGLYLLHGSAFVFASTPSKMFLLSMTPASLRTKSLYLVKSFQCKDDGSVSLHPLLPIPVELLHIEPTTQIALLLEICPSDEYNLCRIEGVRIILYPVSLFLDGEIIALSPQMTRIVPVLHETSHHCYLRSD
jgi:hypothetical protein